MPTKFGRALGEYLPLERAELGTHYRDFRFDSTVSTAPEFISEVVVTNAGDR